MQLRKGNLMNHLMLTVFEEKPLALPGSAKYMFILCISNKYDNEVIQRLIKSFQIIIIVMAFFVIVFF